MQRPRCFGVLEEVFPVGAHGLREVPARCWECGWRVECLRTAVGRSGQGSGGRLGRFVRRWSRLKMQARRQG